MKKSITLFVILCMLLTIAAGCTTGTTSAPTNAPTTAGNETTGTTASQLVKITLDPNHDGFTANVSEVAPGSVLKLSGLKRYGYNFSNWYLDAAGTTALPEGATADKDMTVYAGWTAWDASTTAKMDAFIAEYRLGYYIGGRPTAYESKSFNTFFEYYYKIINGFKQTKNPGDYVTDQMTADLKALREKVVQIADPESVSLYMWSDGKMAVEDGMDKKEFFATFDEPDFKPFLVTYMVKDQSLVKGNIIVIAGGAYTNRANYEEAYNTAELFRAQNYNAYVLQRRVAPFANIDSSLDLQRSVRYLRYHADELGIAKTENIVACGFSGGGGTTIGAVENLYGDIQPSAIYPSYVSDEIDKVNSDLSAMLIIYGAFGELKTANPKIPAGFIVVGSSDDLAASGCVALYSQLQKLKVPAELHAFAAAPHGFGPATGIPGYSASYAGVNQWTKLAGIFLDVKFGYTKASEIPAK